MARFLISIGLAITNYDYLQSAPNFMIERVQHAIAMIELYVANLLNEKGIGLLAMNMLSNQNLTEKLVPKEAQSKTKVLKI